MDEKSLDEKSIDESSLEIFREIGNIGAGNAATALAGILGRQVRMSVPQAEIVPFNTIVNILDGPETVVAGILVDMKGDLNGYILLLLSLQDCAGMVSLTLGDLTRGGRDSPPYFSDLESSALLEISNILVGSFITSISSLTGLRIQPSTPQMTVDMLGAIMSIAAIEYGLMGDSVLFLKTEFSEETDNIAGHFFLIPDYESYKTLMNSLCAQEG